VVYDRLPRTAEELSHCAALVVGARTPTAIGFGADDVGRAASLLRGGAGSVLWVCGRAETVAPLAGGVQPVQSPVSFDAIAHFLTAAGAAQTRSSAAA
jgi:hypothetical protein